LRKFITLQISFYDINLSLGVRQIFHCSCNHGQMSLIASAFSIIS
jgi:hypothetical protein